MATKLVFCGKKVNLPAVREQAFYLTTDTHEVYFGQNLYTEPVRFVPERETTPAQGVLYILPPALVRFTTALHGRPSSSRPLPRLRLA